MIMESDPGKHDLTILAEMLHEPANALDVSRRTRLSAGLVYTALRTLEEAGLVEGTWEEPEPIDRPRRRLFQATPSGRVEVAARRSSGFARCSPWWSIGTLTAWASGPAR
jgi:DNA-binding PadR family transcriptional regulator